MLDEENLERLKNKLTEPKIRDLTQVEIEAVNEIKDVQKDVATVWKEFKEDPVVKCDMRQMAIARTHFEQGFMAMVKAITRPEDPFEG